MQWKKRWGRCSRAALLVTLSLSACSIAPPAAPTSDAAARESLFAVSWMRSSLERHFLVEQTYRAATAALDGAIAAPGTAAIEQASMSGYASLPPAVVMDIDETTIDTMEFAARLVRERRYFDREVAVREWPAWLRDPDNGRAVPGAAAFVAAARSRGVQVIFVTNRECPAPVAGARAAGDCPERTATVRALARSGVPDVREEDVWMAGGAERWPVDKSSRRLAIAKTHRIVMLVGDDLQDFVPRSVAEQWRAAPAARAGDAFGVRWFLLPNPVYGSWERFVGRSCPDGAERVDAAHLCHDRALVLPR
jgi:acid phosphatase